MIIQYILEHTDKNKREDIVSVLVFGLVYGLVFGLVSVLVYGLVFGLVYGLVFGLVYGLVFGLAAGLVYGLVFGLVYGLVSGLAYLPLPFELYWLIIGIIILGELFFWLDKEKPEKKCLWFTARKKAENCFESALIVVNTLNVYYLLTIYWNYDEFLKWVGYIGIVVIVIGIVYGWLRLNHLRYRDIKEKKVSK